MKHRITYLLDAAENIIDPASCNVQSQSIDIPGVRAAKEWRITTGLDELPATIANGLKDTHELHVRWSSASAYEAKNPLVSRVTPGLHVSYTPQSRESENAICDFLKTVFGVSDLTKRCIEETFSKAPVLSERFAHVAAFQYYSQLDSPSTLLDFVRQLMCPSDNQHCKGAAESLASASYVDIDYDTISGMVTSSIFWPHAPGGGPWNEIIKQSNPSDRVEVGLLSNRKATEAEELSMEGWLTVLGQNDRPAPTRFSFPSRHHPMPDDGSVYTSTFRHPTGLHPILDISISGAALEAPSRLCALHAYLTLPSHLFIDRYQLSDTLFLASQNLVSLRSLSGETDLEAPDWVVKRWGSAALIEIATPVRGTAQDWNVSIPMHLRYLTNAGSNQTSTTVSGTRESSIEDVTVPWPVVFWACMAEEGLKMSINPFDRVNLGYDGLFGPKTMFYHVSPSPSTAYGLLNRIQVPILDVQEAADLKVELITGVVVMLGFVWICWKLLSANIRGDESKESANSSKAKKEM